MALNNNETDFPQSETTGPVTPSFGTPERKPLSQYIQEEPGDCALGDTSLADAPQRPRLHKLRPIGDKPATPDAVRPILHRIDYPLYEGEDMICEGEGVFRETVSDVFELHEPVEPEEPVTFPLNHLHGHDIQSEKHFTDAQSRDADSCPPVQEQIALVPDCGQDPAFPGTKDAGADESVHSLVVLESPVVVPCFEMLHESVKREEAAIDGKTVIDEETVLNETDTADGTDVVDKIIEIVKTGEVDKEANSVNTEHETGVADETDGSDKTDEQNGVIKLGEIDNTGDKDKTEETDEANITAGERIAVGGSSTPEIEADVHQPVAGSSPRTDTLTLVDVARDKESAIEPEPETERTTNQTERADSLEEDTLEEDTQEEGSTAQGGFVSIADTITFPFVETIPTAISEPVVLYTDVEGDFPAPVVFPVSAAFSKEERREEDEDHVDAKDDRTCPTAVPGPTLVLAPQTEPLAAESPVVQTLPKRDIMESVYGDSVGGFGRRGGGRFAIFKTFVALVRHREESETADFCPSPSNDPSDREDPRAWCGALSDCQRDSLFTFLKTLRTS